MKKKRTALAIVGMLALFVTSRSEASGQSQIDRLTAAQVQAIRAVRTRAEKKAAPLAQRLADTARLIYENLLSDKEDEALRQRLEREMDKIVVDLVAIKGQSIREMVAVLTQDQKKLLKVEMKKPDAPTDLSELILRIFKITDR